LGGGSGMSDIKTIYDAIAAKRQHLATLTQYYEGNQPTVYLTQRLREIFRGVDLVFTENWCSVVVDACKDRITLNGFDVKDSRVQKILDQAWAENELGIEASDIHETALVCGEAYLIVWPNEETGQAEAYYNDPQMVAVLYDAEKPRVKRCAGKMWEHADGTARMTLYYPDHLEYYESKQKFQDVSSVNAFQPMLAEGANWPTNDYGEVPVFCFKPNRKMLSDLQNVIPVQNGVNKLLADMLVAAEYGAFRQRWVITGSEMEGKVSSQPGEMMQIPPGDGEEQDAEVGEFGITELKNYLDAIDNLSAAIGKVTSTPRHYFFSQGGDPSGEALIAMEAPLNKKAQKRIDRFASTWREAAAFMALIGGLTIQATEIEPLFEKPETVQPKTEAEIVKINVEAGMPLTTALREAGWSEAKIAQMEKDQQKDKGAKTAMAQALLEQQRLASEQENPDEDPDPEEMKSREQGAKNGAIS
jgi:hypothetical protein